MNSALCKRLGIQFPLFAFSHCRDVVAEVSKAGGFGARTGAHPVPNPTQPPVAASEAALNAAMPVPVG